jgi:hypothetical protein
VGILLLFWALTLLLMPRAAVWCSWQLRWRVQENLVAAARAALCMTSETNSRCDQLSLQAGETGEATSLATDWFSRRLRMKLRAYAGLFKAQLSNLTGFEHLRCPLRRKLHIPASYQTTTCERVNKTLHNLPLQHRRKAIRLAPNTRRRKRTEQGN